MAVNRSQIKNTTIQTVAIPIEGPSREGENGKGRQRGRHKQQREPGDSRNEARKKCNRRALHIYKGPRSRQGAPGRGSRERMEPDGWLSVVWVGFWACGPRSPPEDPKQRRREGKGRQRGRQKQQSESQGIQGRKQGSKTSFFTVFRAPRRPRRRSWRCSKTVVFTWFWAPGRGKKRKKVILKEKTPKLTPT